jgi:N6-adenosine-specific RNA methylase IME4
MMSGPGLVKYDAARAALAAARRVDEVIKVRDEAQRLKLYARQAKDRGMIADAAELQLNAERRLGEMLVKAKSRGQLSKGGRPSGRRKPVNDSDGFSKVTLQAAGISRDLSAKSQQLAQVPERRFAALIAETREKILAGGARLLNPQSNVLVSAHKEKRRREAVALSLNPRRLPEGPFAGGTADPPWIDPENPIGFNRRHYGFQYPLMTPEEIAALPVGKTFGPRAILLLWITRYHLAIGSHLVVLKAWDFEPRTVVSWNKIIAGLGNGFVRDVSEHIVYAVRGDVPPPDAGDRPLSLFNWKKTKLHSQKPDWPEQQVELILPGGAFVQLFHRGRARPGWGAWGNEARQVVGRIGHHQVRPQRGVVQEQSEGAAQAPPAAAGS